DISFHSRGCHPTVPDFGFHLLSFPVMDAMECGYLDAEPQFRQQLTRLFFATPGKTLQKLALHGGRIARFLQKEPLISRSDTPRSEKDSVLENFWRIWRQFSH